MDRLVCGDVGFGKTEVAIRAAFKAVQDGKQVAVLVPTTLLAQQHHQTFSDRFAGYPVRVEVLSPLPHPRAGAGGGQGAHDPARSTSSSAPTGCSPTTSYFKDLGLLVVDEEQRFGVTHKEQIKQLKTGVDVLTLTATPIPRTLEMSLTGIRDLTLLNTPPADRMPILTYVGEYDDRAVGEAIRRELLREGQVFYVHNRVQDIEKTANHVRDLVPEARVADRPRADGRGHPRAARAGVLRGRLRRARLHHDHRERHRHAHGEHARVRPGRPPRPRPAPPAPRPGRPVRAAGLRLPLRAAGPGAQRGGLRAPQDDRRGHRARLRLQDRHARPRDPRRRQPPRHRPERPHRGGRLRPLLPDGLRGGGRAEGRADQGAGRDQARPARCRPTSPGSTCRRRSSASRPTGGWPRSPPTTRCSTSAPSGRTATGPCRRRPRRCWPSPGCGPRRPAPACARSWW